MSTMAETGQKRGALCLRDKITQSEGKHPLRIIAKKVNVVTVKHNGRQNPHGNV